ncbi:hypothetical protein Vadar_002431 [Vaccinium darrowii]|uniref:Uncharacterized protein n=1 Tax=Vaccinium darrowii TaxID=229202 RepID=A0ACB7Y505_9ERIC|nr:hypothetical protein Vadar_002431 [Vaccinium darrowii]
MGAPVLPDDLTIECGGSPVLLGAVEIPLGASGSGGSRGKVGSPSVLKGSMVVINDGVASVVSLDGLELGRSSVNKGLFADKSKLVVIPVSPSQGESSDSLVAIPKKKQKGRAKKALVGTGAWLQLGDYNVVRKMAERMEGFHNDAAVEFNDCLYDLELEDMPAKGFWYTWTYKRGGLGDNKSELDQAMVNARWLTDFLASEAWFLHPGVFDHCKILIIVLPVVSV